MLAWHFLVSEWPGRTKYGSITPPSNNIKWKVDYPYSVYPCDYGLHASDLIIDALRYINNVKVILCRVKLSGVIKTHKNINYSPRSIDKYVASERTILWRVPISEKTMQLMLKAALVPFIKKELKLNKTYSSIYEELSCNRRYSEVLKKVGLVDLPTEFSDIDDIYSTYNRKIRRRINDFIVKNIVEGLQV